MGASGGGGWMLPQGWDVEDAAQLVEWSHKLGGPEDRVWLPKRQGNLKRSQMQLISSEKIRVQYLKWYLKVCDKVS